MRAELAETVQALLATATLEPRERTEEETVRLVGLATLVVRARSAVERDSYSREIELVPGPEAPTRIIIVLDRLLGGLDAIGVDRTTAWKVVTKAALDSIPALRLSVLYALEEGQKDTNQVATDVRHPSQTTRRALEDLVAHHLVELERQGEGKAHLWSLSAFASARLQGFPETAETNGTFPEMADGLYTPPLKGSSKELNAKTGTLTNSTNRNHAHLEPPLPDFEPTHATGPPPDLHDDGIPF
jgi:hypothetical protein